jgi:hypothetical protein
LAEISYRQQEEPLQMDRPRKLIQSVYGPVSPVLAAFAGMFLWMVGASSVQAQMVTVNPVEAPGPLTNPLMGFRPGLGNYSQYPYPTVIHQYIPWKTIENQESDSVQKIRDYCNAQWANLPANNVKVIPRVYIDWDASSGNEAWPSDLTPGDWSSQQFKDRVVRLVGRLGEVWNNDPRVAWVQTGIIGYWGEQESPVGIGQDGWGQRLGEAFTAAFPNKKFIVRNMGSWPGYNVGVYWDSFGHPGQRPWAWTDIINFNKQGRYLTQVVEGEVAYNWGVAGEFKDLYGGVWDPNANNGNGDWVSSPDITLSNAQYTDNMIDVIRELHCSALGWISSYSANNATVQTQAARMQKEFGYRFHITEFSCSARTEPGDNLDLQFKVKNKGSAPFYENWPLAVVLVDKNTRQLLWKATIPNVDIRKWQPGADYNKTTRTYQTPAQEHLISASIPLPANLPVGEHLIGLTILEPLSRTPGLFFAIPNFFKQSQTQPLCKIGIGMNATGHTLDGIAFDDLVSDDTRSYTMTPQGPNYTLTLEPSSLGIISQMSANGSYAKDTGVEVRANGRIGYGFSSWGGALAGSTRNPAIIVMDANKSISANYVPVATYRLNTISSNGLITLNPPGGVYNVGTEVTVTTTPSSGYAFSSWSGDLSGSASSATITMTGHKSITANFIVPPITGPASFGINCGGPSYTAGDGVVYSADGVWNSGGNAYSIGSRSISNTTDDLLHLTNRWGNTFGYSIPLTNGDYEVTLIFSEIVFNAAGSRVFNVALEGSQVIANLDVFSKVGKNAAYNESRIVTVNDGAVNIAFSSVVDNANISAIKVTRTQRPNSFTLVSNATNGAVSFDPPGGIHDNGSVVTVTATPSSGYLFHSWSGDLAGSLNPAPLTMNGNKSVTANFVSDSSCGTFDFNVNCGGAAYTAGDGSVFGADIGGNTYTTTSPISGTTDGTLYQSERWGASFGYSIPVTNGEYEVTLMFAEIYHNAANKRVFHVDIEGARVINSLDIWSKVGKDAVYNEQHLAVVNDGQLNITFSKVVDNAKVSAIKVKRLQPPVFLTLTATATNGSIVLSPPGGVYEEGTIVTMTASPNSAYKFESWSGDLVGTTSPAAITMNGNKSVTASFSMLAPGSQTVLLVVGNAASPGTSDIAIKNRLQNYGFTVQVIGDAAVTTADATGKVLIITSSTVSSSNVSTKFQTVAVPVINWETALQDEFLFTTPTNQGTASGQTSLNIISPGHPLAASLPAGPRTVTTISGGFSWGQPGGSPIIIARLNDGTDSPCIYAYEAGAAMTGTLVAPARRVHVFFQGDTFASLNDDGLKLFDATVSWSIGQKFLGGGHGPTSFDYANWYAGHGVTGGQNEDDDQDDRTNYEEYVFGQHPKKGASVNPVSISPSISAGTFSYTRRKSSLTGLSYSVWYSTSLEAGSWIKDTGAIEGTPALDGEVETVPVTLSASLLSHNSLFIQIRTE